MTDEQRDLLGQARDSIDAATLLLDAGYAGFSAARSYYAMFYVAEALLLGRGFVILKALRCHRGFWLALYENGRASG